MNDLVLRATVGAQMKAMRTQAWVASRLRNDDGADNVPVGLLVAIVIAVIVLVGIGAAIFGLKGKATGCMTAAQGLTTGSTTITC